MDANFSTVASERETTLGTPNLTHALKKLRITGESLDYQKDTVTSAEVRDDRQISDLVKVGFSALGGLQFELSYTDFQSLFECAFFNLKAASTVSALTVSLTASTQVIAASAGAFNSIVVGGYYRITGAATTANNGVKLVVAKAGDGSTITLLAGSITADEASPSITMTGNVLKNGITPISNTLERRIPAAAGGYAYQTFTGMQVDTLKLDFEAKKIVTGEIGFLGLTSDLPAVSLMDSTGTKATGTLTFAANADDGDTAIIGSKTYTFKTALTGGGVTANEVLIGADASASLDNLIAAINGASGGGTTYGSATVAHTLVSAAAGAGDTMVITALLTGVAGNSIGTTETFTDVGNVFGAATLTGGIDPTAYTAASTDSPVNATNNVSAVVINAASSTEKMKKLSLSIANNLRGRDAIGSEGFFSIGIGSFNVTGSIEMYFRSNALIAAVRAHSYMGISFITTDNVGNSICVNLPRINFSKGTSFIEGLDTDVMVPLDFQAILDPVTNATLIVSYVPHA